MLTTFINAVCWHNLKQSKQILREKKHTVGIEIDVTWIWKYGVVRKIYFAWSVNGIMPNIDEKHYFFSHLTVDSEYGSFGAASVLLDIECMHDESVSVFNPPYPCIFHSFGRSMCIMCAVRAYLCAWNQRKIQPKHWEAAGKLTPWFP